MGSALWMSQTQVEQPWDKTECPMHETIAFHNVVFGGLGGLVVWGFGGRRDGPHASSNLND